MTGSHAIRYVPRASNDMTGGNILQHARYRQRTRSTDFAIWLSVCKDFVRQTVDRQYPSGFEPDRISSPFVPLTHRCGPSSHGQPSANLEHQLCQALPYLCRVCLSPCRNMLRYAERDPVYMQIRAALWSRLVLPFDDNGLRLVESATPRNSTSCSNTTACMPSISRSHIHLAAITFAALRLGGATPNFYRRGFATCRAVNTLDSNVVLGQHIVCTSKP